MILLMNPKNGDVIEASDTMYPSRLEVVSKSKEFVNSSTTTYGYVCSGECNITTDGLRVKAEQGTFFSVPARFSIEVKGVVVTMQRIGFRGLLIVGRIESFGRLAYIDGCSSTILVCPPRLGDPVLNYLHFPAGVCQSPHIHPSVRIGVVASGQGWAHGKHIGESPQRLAEGMVFMIDAQELHSFSTSSDGGALEIVVYHPDSDWGPTDGDHPMLNRTYIRKSY